MSAFRRDPTTPGVVYLRLLRGVSDLGRAEYVGTAWASQCRPDRGLFERARHQRAFQALGGAWQLGTPALVTAARSCTPAKSWVSSHAGPNGVRAFVHTGAQFEPETLGAHRVRRSDQRLGADRRQRSPVWAPTTISTRRVDFELNTLAPWSMAAMTNGVADHTKVIVAHACPTTTASFRSTPPRPGQFRAVEYYHAAFDIIPDDDRI